MRRWILTYLAMTCSGCTAFTLEQYTANQIHSAARERYTEVLHCLAMVAADSSTLPPFSVIADGIVKLQDTGVISATTVWNRMINGFATQNLPITASRNPVLQWYLSPVADYEKLQGLRCACNWVIYGPGHTCDNCAAILADPRQDLSPGFHFGVEDRLARLPPGWLHIGRRKDVPARACYKAHYGNTWVWVLPDGMEGLAEFTLVFLDIATIDLLAIQSPPVFVTLTRTQDSDLTFDQLDPSKKSVLVFQETRTIKPEFKTLIEAKMKTRFTLSDLNKTKDENKRSEGKKDENKRTEDVNAKQRDERKNDKDDRKNVNNAKASDNDRIEIGVPISWKEWMVYTTPFSGQRSSATPLGTSQTFPHVTSLATIPLVPNGRSNSPSQAFPLPERSSGLLKPSYRQN